MPLRSSWPPSATGRVTCGIRSTGALAPRVPTDVVPADPGSPILLVDVDADSPERGRLIAVVAQTLDADPFTPEHVLAVAPRRLPPRPPPPQCSASARRYSRAPVI